MIRSISMTELTTEGWGLDQDQAATLHAIMSAPTRKEAAHILGISESTLYRRLRDPDLKAAYRAARHEALSDATTALQVTALAAVVALRELVTDRTINPHVRAVVARTVLDFAYKTDELENVEAEIEELKERLGIAA
jgi:hypothetical protein